jgi:peptidoglycan hydrolase CwlO-like protein
MLFINFITYTMNIFELYEKISEQLDIKNREILDIENNVQLLTEKKADFCNEVHHLGNKIRDIDLELDQYKQKLKYTKGDIERMEKSLKNLDIWEIICTISEKSKNKEEAKERFNLLVEKGFLYKDYPH